MKKFKGKTVVISGGSRGIGRACVLAFAGEGANVIFTYSSSMKEASALKTEAEFFGSKCLAIKADAGNYEDAKTVIEETMKLFSKLDILINNAGITRDKALMMMTNEDWNDVIDVNLNGVYNLSRAAITTMLKQKEGNIINISSIAGITGLARQTNYCASKAGIIGFSKALAKEVASYGVRVNCICPGYIETDMISFMKDDQKKTALGQIPAKRFGKPDEVAELCLFLASESSRYIIGETIRIDGGLAI